MTKLSIHKIAPSVGYLYTKLVKPSLLAIIASPFQLIPTVVSPSIYGMREASELKVFTFGIKVVSFS